jgi:hypothetical protein
MLRHAKYHTGYRLALSFLLLFTLPWLASAAEAAEDCADTPQKLIQYLNKAETQSTPYTIKLVVGNYVLTGNKVHWLFTADTRIEGGYASGCSGRGTQSSDATTINSAGLPGLGLVLDSETNLEVDGIGFVGGYVTELGGGGLLDPGSLRLGHSHFLQTRVRLLAQGGQLNVQNVLADHAPSDPLDRCSVTVYLSDDSTAQMAFVSVDTSAGDDTCFVTDPNSHHTTVKVFNSIFWNSDNNPSRIRLISSDWHVGDVFNVAMTNSLFQVGVADGGFGVLTESNSVHTDPLWRDPAIVDYRLRELPPQISPAINVGAPGAQIPGGISATDVDVGGNPRVIGSAPDMGAYESAVDDGALFAVTTATDCSTPLNQPSCGSLRDAIARATAPTATAPVKTIKFWIIDWMNQPICPAVINVGSSLPDITTNVVIDGFSQGSINEIDPPLSWPNIDPYIFNASLCTNIVGPGTGVAFRVPSGSNGSLTLRGVGLGGFTQGVMLLGGANHQIAGNQFGGITSNGVNLQGFTVQAVNVSPTVQPSGALIIGGDNPADRNVFLNAFSGGGAGAKAIFIGPGTVSDPDHCQIDSNLVGILPDGTYAQGNDYGMMLDGDGCTIRNNWIAGSHKGAVWVQGTHYVLQSNVIGLAPRSFQQQINGGYGIEISGSNNIVGASASNVVPFTLFDRGLGNYIQDTDYNGIVVEGTGTGNSIRGNWIINSGIGSGLLALDLGNNGPTANDVGDADAGPNGLQNFPDPFSLTWAAPPQPGATNDATVSVVLNTPPGPTSYNVDVYLGEGCDATGRGLPELWIGRYSGDVAAGAMTSTFQIPVKIPDYFDPALAAVSLTATSFTDQNTSEVGPCLSIDTIFRNGLDP